ncbi:MAG TPA: aminotransferase class V-fold PLP-dependent enzyme [Bryobacteraceae bacterium]|jgi:L-seryl-tRNA(Ser) seleniumtransferase|nr:aminotransferase class V-fold PLP-dependent enzyme [Bryobacteraceae bacterium]
MSEVNRRELLRRGSLLTLAGTLPTEAKSAAASSSAGTGGAASGEIYRKIGVRPVINARGTFTIITGSESLPQVKQAMDAASRSYVQMDELMEGVSERLAEATGAPWGIITAGCCAALTNTTAACLAGTNPERMQRLPDLTGLKSEVIIPEYSRNVYDHAIRMLGVKIIEVKDPADLEPAFNERTAMVYILAGPGDTGPLGTEAICSVAKRHGVPVIVDAAAEILTMPNVHLQRGATAVAYSGGKCIRGPQAAGLLLGEKNLLQAAWANSAPHHAFGRSLKVGKEEIMGLLAAVEAWKTRDHEAEWKQWHTTLGYIAEQVTTVKGVTTRVTEPEGLSNKTPVLHMSWDANELGITGLEVSKLLLDEEPRIVLGSARGSRPNQMASEVSVTPYMMMPGDEKVVAERLHAVLSRPPKFENPVVPHGETAAIAGQWQATLQFDRGSAVHTLIFEQHGDDLVGTHQGEFVSGDLTGKVTANQVSFRSSQKIQGQRLSYTFSGVVNGDAIAGAVDLGEYGHAQWSAKRHEYRTLQGAARPIKKA